MHYWNYSLGPGGLLRGTQAKTIAAGPTESIRNRGSSLGKGKAPKLPRPWLTVEAQPCTGLLQAAQLSQVMAALAELCQEPSISQPFSRGHILPDLTFFLPPSRMFPEPCQGWYEYSQGWAFNSHSLALWAAVYLFSLHHYRGLWLKPWVAFVCR